MDSLQVKKVLNNNVIIAIHPTHGETVVIGKGIGFDRKPKDHIPLGSIEKMFILTKEKEMEQYKSLIHQVEESLIEVMNDVIFYIQQHAGAPLNEHIHIALTDHIAFAVKRLKQRIPIINPFLYETREFYPREYAMAEHVVAEINRRLSIELPEDEVGFVALHIYSALTNRHVTEVKEHSRLVAELIELIESRLGIKVQKDSLNYSRLLRHLMVALERIRRGENLEEPGKISEVIKNEYPEMYSLAWTLMKVIQQRLHKPVYDAEAVYLTLHLQRLAEKRPD
ncbi:glucose PTS transporter transcription antiterminator GlcT [Gorillibacterium sp. sgz5001074]|uniref:glucose PTS transporter transcription antiterminator GlcT n=1 Tax=Gorillibacterium sp. sgz5001074 TaxID=3446695 RepID=UPI003F66C0F8